MSGPSEDYDDADEAGLEAALDDAWNAYDASEGEEEATGAPTRMTIKAEVEWAGVIDRAHGGVRTVHLDDLDLTGVRDALSAARKAHGKASTAGSSMRARSWEDQLKTLMKSPRGTAATDRAGLSPTSKTLMTWLSGESDPNPANRAKIATAYQDIRNQLIGEARTKAGQADHRVAGEVNKAVEERYGQEVRFRRISRIELYD